MSVWGIDFSKLDVKRRSKSLTFGQAIKQSLKFAPLKNVHVPHGALAVGRPQSRICCARLQIC